MIRENEVRERFDWATVVLAGLVYTIVVGATHSSFGLFVVPVSTDFGLSRANMNSGLILLNLGSAVFAPVVGRMLDRLSLRSIMACSAVVFGACLAVLGLSRSLWLDMAILFVPLTLALSGAGTLTMSVLIARRFRANRARAMVLSAIGLSFGGIAVSPVVGWLIASQGWRTALVVLGIGCSVALLVLTSRVRDRPATTDALAGGGTAAAASAPAVTLTPLAVISMPQFWSISLAIAMAQGVAQALSISLVPMALDAKITMVQATTLISISAAAALVGKLGTSIVADRIDHIRLLAGFFFTAIFASALLLVSTGFAALATSSALLGLTAGTMMPIYYTLLADRFGVASFGTVRGAMQPVIALGSAGAVRLAGEIYDRTGGYRLLFVIFIAAEIAAILLILSTRFTRRVESPIPATS